MAQHSRLIAVIAVSAAAAAVIGITVWLTAGVQLPDHTPAAPQTTVSAPNSAADASSAAQADHNASFSESAVTAPPEENRATAAAQPSNDSALRFSGVYAPDSKAEDAETGQVTRLRDLFGDKSREATLTFREDGTFTDSLRSADGVYQLENGALTAVYQPDERMDVTVTAWKDDGVTPVTFCVVYHLAGGSGYKVFYAEAE